MRRRAFTLTELLVVAALLGVLSAILFPVFASVRERGKRTVCVSRMRSVATASLMYVSEWDDRIHPAGVRAGDPTWIARTLPYARALGLYRCAAHDHDAVEPDAEVLGDADARLDAAARRSETGFNFQALAPEVWEDDRYVLRPRVLSEIAEPSVTLLHVESRGSHLVEPPCRFESRGEDTFGVSGRRVLSLSGGWLRIEARHGGAWAWHGSRTMTAALDGSVRSRTIPELAAGCDVREAWAGSVTDPSRYLWEAR